MARWDPSEHPRYPNGRFRPKFSQSVRLSTRSVSYNAGVRVPVIPGRAQLYVGALVRVERVQGGTFGQTWINRGVDKVAGFFGDVGGRSPTARLLKGEDLQVGNFRVNASGITPQINPTFRMTSTPATRANARLVERPAANERSPGRRPRTRSTARSGVRPATITPGVVAMPPTAKPKRARKAVTSGRKIKR